VVLPAARESQEQTADLVKGNAFAAAGVLLLTARPLTEISRPPSPKTWAAFWRRPAGLNSSRLQRRTPASMKGCALNPVLPACAA
jgi:hypothetical protein